jgi:Helicase HerA, central domain
MIIGQIVGGKKLELDLPTLVDTRLLIQANSGGGKSWLLRLIAERAGIQTIVLDNEGEFASLREAVDVLLVGAGGELTADPRHAALLARRLLEYKVSAVVDLYELKLPDRRRFLKLFLESLVHLPRDLWRPTLVVLDEAHIYCPERGSEDAESTEAVISLMSQGRKRGFAGIIATQRLSKLHKDAAAEANNVIIGRTWLDADQVRAGDALGLSKSDRLKLRDVGQGEFYAFGPAFGQPGVVHFRSDQVRTTHPRPGQRHLLTAPAPSRAIRGVLAKFADLPQEAEDEILGLDEARRRIAELERQIKSGNRAGEVQRIDQTTINRAITVAVEREGVEWQRKMAQGRARLQRLGAALASTEQSLSKIQELLEESEREWLGPQSVDSTSGSQLNQLPVRIVKPGPDRGELNGTLKLAAGERRILLCRNRRRLQQLSWCSEVARTDRGRRGQAHDFRSRNSGARFMGAPPRRCRADRLLAKSLEQGRAVNFRNAHPRVSCSSQQGRSCGKGRLRSEWRRL